MSSNNRNKLWSGVAAIALTSLTVPAFAQDPTAASGASQNSSSALEEVVITAERQKTNIEKTAISVAAISDKALEQQGIHTEADLQSAVAGLFVRETLDSNQLNYSIRGQSVDAFTGSQPAVQPYLDDIPIPGSVASTFYDFGSVEVLKGPQGTLFGRNTTGGAVLFQTAAPTNELGGFVDQRLGDYNLRETQAAANIPLVDDKLLLRIAGDYDTREGYTHNLYNNSTIGDVLRQSLRASLLFKPVDNVTNTLVMDFGHVGGSGTPSVLYYSTPGPTNVAAFLFSPAVDGLTGAGSWASYLAAHPGYYPYGLTSYLAFQKANGPFTVDFYATPRVSASNYFIADTASWDIAPDLQLKNIFGYVNSNEHQNQIDWSGSPYDIEGNGPGGNVTNTRQMTEELQLLGKVFNGDLNYAVGFFYDSSSLHQYEDIYFFDLSPVIPVTHPIYGTDLYTTSYAGYAQGTYNLSNLTGIKGLGVTAGLRYTSETQKSDEIPGNVYYGAAGIQNNVSISADKLSYQFGVQEQLYPDLLLYAVTRHSFRSGGFNVYAPQTGPNGVNTFQPEVANDVEIGAKFQDRVEGVPVRLNVALFHEWIDNIQRSVYTDLPPFGIGAITVNIPQAQVQGIEFEGQVSPTSWLNLGANLAFNDASFTQNTATVFGSTYQYGPYSDTPRWAGSAFTQVFLPTPDPTWGQFSVRADMFAQTGFYFGSLNNTVEPGTHIPGYGIVNFRVGLDDIGDRGISIAAYVKNAFDHTYFVGGLPTSSANVYSTTEAVPGAPRTFYFEGRVAF